jgi:hypothetical protein
MPTRCARPSSRSARRGEHARLSGARPRAITSQPTRGSARARDDPRNLRRPGAGMNIHAVGPGVVIDRAARKIAEKIGCSGQGQDCNVPCTEGTHDMRGRQRWPAHLRDERLVKSHVQNHTPVRKVSNVLIQPGLEVGGTIEVQHGLHVEAGNCRKTQGERPPRTESDQTDRLSLAHSHDPIRESSEGARAVHGGVGNLYCPVSSGDQVGGGDSSLRAGQSRGEAVSIEQENQRRKAPLFQRLKRWTEAPGGARPHTENLRVGSSGTVER